MASKGLLDVMEQFELADTVEAKESMDQQDRVLSCRIPLHVRTFFAEVRGCAQGSTLKHSGSQAMSEKDAVIEGKRYRKSTKIRIWVKPASEYFDIFLRSQE
ncbi:hypothetical protein [Pseudomonas frederiksbergensis]|uniref:hypothetical protein n=1 Tax=Pseudomonas frederiksbergensis TaxID=104087 RepID=UPI00161681A5|nr:hypothetical protein [Pseudomonas frederiksbergensis]